MRKATILICVLALAPALAFAGEQPTTLERVEALAAHVAKGDVDFDSTNELYKAAKKALEEAPDEKAQARYEEIQPQVADAMRRNDMPTSAWIMGIFGASLLWGGLAFCIGVARKKGRSGGQGDA